MAECGCSQGGSPKAHRTEVAECGYPGFPEAHQAFKGKVSSVSDWGQHNMGHGLVSPDQPYTPELARQKLADIENYERERKDWRARLDNAGELERLRPKATPAPQAPLLPQVFAARLGGYWNYLLRLVLRRPKPRATPPPQAYWGYPPSSQPTVAVQQPTLTDAYVHPTGPPPFPQFPHTHTHHIPFSAAQANPYPQTIPQEMTTQVTVGHPPNPIPTPSTGLRGFTPLANYTNGNPFLATNRNRSLSSGTPSLRKPGKKSLFERIPSNTYPQTIPQQKITQVTVGHPPNQTPPPHGQGFIPPIRYMSGNGNPFLGAAAQPGKKPLLKRMFSVFGPTESSHRNRRSRRDSY